MISPYRFGFAKKLSTALIASVVSISAAHAFTLDTSIGSASLANSGDATELAAIQQASGDSSLTLLSKVNAGGGTALPNPDSTGQFYIDVGTQEPAFFLLKFGTGGTGSAEDTFFFDNIGELTKLVFSNDDVNFLSGGNCGAQNPNACNIGRLSHYAIYASANGGGGTDGGGGGTGGGTDGGGGNGGPVDGGGGNGGPVSGGGGGNGGTPVPEPATVALIGLGLLGVAASRRKAALNKQA